MSPPQPPPDDALPRGPRRLIPLARSLSVGVFVIILAGLFLVGLYWLAGERDERPRGPAVSTEEHDDRRAAAIGVWVGWSQPFRYDGEAVHLHMSRLHAWQEGTDDDIYRLPAQWEGNTLYHRHDGGVGWSKVAEFVDGHFVIKQDDTTRVLRKVEAAEPGSLEESLARDRPMWEPAEARERRRPLEFLLEWPGPPRAATAGLTEKVEPVSTLTEPPDGPFQLRGYPYYITQLAFSPGGRRLVSLGTTWDPDRERYSGSVTSWDLNARREEGLFEGITTQLCQVAFSPDGKYLAAACDAPTAIIWGTADRRQALRLPDCPGRLRDLAYSPDGLWLATAGDGPAIILWKPTTGERLLTLTSQATKVDHVSFLPDGQRLVSVGDETKVSVWDVTSGKVTNSFKAADERVAERVMSVAFHPDGKRMAVGGWGPVKVLDLATGKRLGRFSHSEAHQGPVRALAFSPDGSLLASGGDDGTFKLWDAETGEMLVTIRGYRRDVFVLEFSPDGKRLATAGRAESIELWDVDALRQKIRSRY
jgi:hypothetical protein